MLTLDCRSSNLFMLSYEFMWIVFFLLFLFFPILLVIGLINPAVFSRHGKTLTRKQIVMAGITLTFVSLFLSVATSPSSSKSSEKAIQQPNQVAQQSIATKSAENPQPPPKPLSVTDKLWLAIDKGDTSKRAGYELEYFDFSDPQMAGTVSLSYTSDSFLDESWAVGGAFNTFVSFGQKAFKIDGVKRIVLAFKSTFTDSYGKNSVGDIIRFGMTKEEFEKYDWTNLNHQPIFYKIQRSATPFYVNPSVMLKIEPEKITLSITE